MIEKGLKMAMPLLLVALVGFTDLILAIDHGIDLGGQPIQLRRSQPEPSTHAMLPIHGADLSGKAAACGRRAQ
jgi:hypothetical protein